MSKNKGVLVFRREAWMNMQVNYQNQPPPALSGEIQIGLVYQIAHTQARI
jgi:hypothetical protein